ncbi:hypothetical protein niasHT_005745 [Heterodera trifolii]|uniref:F-box domain-containing protein n=1 Tax=Heterodera trifolii TaxID=157864 RepID=A0ABD2LYZ1_9BILA
MSDNRKEAEEKMAKAIFISGDCWLKVFDLLSPRQLGLGIALISRRLDFYVDEHFKTRRWALKPIQIERKIGTNGTNEMEIANYDGKPMPIPQIQLPRKVSGFERISIFFIDQNVIAFLRRFRLIFAAFPINLIINTDSDLISEFILRNIWPILGGNICGIFLFVNVLHRLRKFVPSILNDCPSLCVVNLCDADIFAEFPANDSAAASDGQAVAKWLFTPRPDGVPKVLKCWWDNNDDGNLASELEAFKAAFASASSPVNFIVIISFPYPLPFDFSVMPFDQINEFTQEHLALKKINNSHRFLLIRCPIARDASKWTKWEKEAIDWQIYVQWNQIDIQITNEDDIGDWLLNAMIDQK